MGFLLTKDGCKEKKKAVPQQLMSTYIPPLSCCLRQQRRPRSGQERLSRRRMPAGSPQPFLRCGAAVPPRTHPHTHPRASPPPAPHPPKPSQPLSPPELATSCSLVLCSRSHLPMPVPASAGDCAFFLYLAHRKNLFILFFWGEVFFLVAPSFMERAEQRRGLPPMPLHSYICAPRGFFV